MTAILALVFEVIGEAGKLAAGAVEASQEQLADATARMNAALEALRGTRREVEHSIDARHAELHAKLDEVANHPDAPADVTGRLLAAIAGVVPSPGPVAGQ